MILELKLRKIDNAVGVVLPEEVLTHLKVAEGDTLTLTESEDGIRLTVGKPPLAKAMAVFTSLSQRYPNALRELAK